MPRPNNLLNGNDNPPLTPSIGVNSDKVMGIMRSLSPITGLFKLLGDHTIGKMKKALHNQIMSVAVSGFIEHSADVQIIIVNPRRPCPEVWIIGSFTSNLDKQSCPVSKSPSGRKVQQRPRPTTFSNW